MLLQCKGVENQVAIKETVESLDSFGYPELMIRSDNESAVRAFHDADAKELEKCFWCQTITQAPQKYDSASAGMVENTIRHVTENVRTLVITGRGLRGVVMSPERIVAVCAVCWTDHSSNGESQGWTHCSLTCVSTPVSSESILAA